MKKTNYLEFVGPSNSKCAFRAYRFQHLEPPAHCCHTVKQCIVYMQALLDLLQSKRFRECHSIIIYCTRREQADRLASLLRTVLSNDESSDSSKKTFVAESYHAGLSAAQRRRIQKQFMTGKYHH